MTCDCNCCFTCCKCPHSCWRLTSKPLAWLCASILLYTEPCLLDFNSLFNVVKLQTKASRAVIYDNRKYPHSHSVIYLCMHMTLTYCNTASNFAVYNHLYFIKVLIFFTVCTVALITVNYLGILSVGEQTTHHLPFTFITSNEHGSSKYVLQYYFSSVIMEMSKTKSESNVICFCKIRIWCHAVNLCHKKFWFLLFLCISKL